MTLGIEQQRADDLADVVERHRVAVSEYRREEHDRDLQKLSAVGPERSREVRRTE